MVQSHSPRPSFSLTTTQFLAFVDSTEDPVVARLSSQWRWLRAVCVERPQPVAVNQVTGIS